MVLENRSEPSSQDAFDQSAPPNDEDPFASSHRGALNGYSIDQSMLQPFPIFGSLLGYNKDTWIKTLSKYISQGERVVKRPLSQEEVDAYAYWTARAISHASYGTPLGVAGACYMAYNSRQTFRFPFWQPTTSTFQPGEFPPKIALLTGNRAIIAWHAARVLAYSVIGSSIGNILMTSYATSAASVNSYMDKRLREVNQAIIRESQSKSKRGPLQPTKQQQHDSRHDHQDDSSPTGGMYQDGGKRWEGNPESAGMDNNSPKDEKPWGKSSRPQPLEVHETQDSGFAVFDDASPTGGQGVVADTTPQQPAGSAWERLRRTDRQMENRQARPDQSEGDTQRPSQSAWAKLRNGPQQGGQDNKPTYTSDSYSETNEQRDSPRAKAQREFDAQLEQERRGIDSSNNGGDQKRW